VKFPQCIPYCVGNLSKKLPVVVPVPIPAYGIYECKSTQNLLHIVYVTGTGSICLIRASVYDTGTAFNAQFCWVPGTWYDVWYLFCFMFENLFLTFIILVQDAAIARTCFSPVDDMASGSGEPNAAVAEDGKSKEDKPQASVYIPTYRLYV
jgi:hypothetical protein